MPARRHREGRHFSSQAPLAEIGFDHHAVAHALLEGFDLTGGRTATAIGGERVRDLGLGGGEGATPPPNGTRPLRITQETRSRT